MRFKVHAVTFDDFGTLRFSVGQEDIIYPILRVLSESMRLGEEKFLAKNCLGGMECRSDL